MKFDTIYDGLIKGTEKLALVGLGYVGMPIAVEFAKHISVIGFDINEKRVNEYANGIDATNEVGEAIKNTTVEFTSDPSRLKEAKFIVVAVPTPVNPDTTPDLRQSRIYVSALNCKDEKDMMRGLKSAAGFLRRELGSRIDLRYTPELQFFMDDSIAHGAHILDLLNHVKPANPANADIVLPEDRE